ncbi:hypothetical protein EV421DRAFT_1734459 [Armillaria borealis]|uniref:DUF6533 domain-containing protein n=1 Tax=Armillaria borealis TaxID=47425 RepID=A0AA39JN43_9AGAR|nr:hypothetical protein EV421DRAFT_1734459 [Armillaria borealis]
MSTVLIRVDQILFSTYAPAVAMVLMLWDHCLMLDEEVAIMWSPRNGRILTKVVHVLNRYFAEAVLMYRLYVTDALAHYTVSEGCKAVWLASTSATLIASISQFYIMMHAYRLWDHRVSVRRTLLVVFGICLTAVTILSGLLVWTYLKTGAKSQNSCSTEAVPKTITCIIGISLVFSVFVVLITIYNLEEPRRPENDLLDSLRRDSARIYFVICVLWLLLLVLSVTIEARLFFALFTLALSLNANIAARVHLRVDGLRLLFHRRPVMIYRGYIEG